MSMTNSNDTSWDRTSNLPICSTEPFFGVVAYLTGDLISCYTLEVNDVMCMIKQLTSFKFDQVLVFDVQRTVHRDIRGRTIKFANSPPCVCRGSTGQKP